MCLAINFTLPPTVEPLNTSLLAPAQTHRYASNPIQHSQADGMQIEKMYLMVNSQSRVQICIASTTSRTAAYSMFGRNQF